MMGVCTDFNNPASKETERPTKPQTDGARLSPLHHDYPPTPCLDPLALTGVALEVRSPWTITNTYTLYHRFQCNRAAFLSLLTNQGILYNNAHTYTYMYDTYRFLSDYNWLVGCLKILCSLPTPMALNFLMFFFFFFPERNFSSPPYTSSPEEWFFKLAGTCLPHLL